MVQDVERLNIVSNSKPLPVVSKPENNSKIEVFKSDASKTNIDEAVFSSTNCNTEPEEKSDNKKKWLVAAGISLGTVAVGIASCLLFKKIPQNILKTQISKTNPKTNALIGDMTNFLTGKKGKHISSDDIVNIFKKYQPDINLKVQDDVPEIIFGSANAVASTGSKAADDLSKYISYNMTIRSKSFMDKLKSLLHIKNNNKEFYVNQSFANNLLHESTHVMQMVTKPTQLAYRRTLKSSLPSTGGWVWGVTSDNAFTYRKLVYKEEMFFDKNNFIKKLMQQIRDPYYMKNNEKMVAVQLKHLIREAQAEKQAYELGELSQLRYKFPKLSQNKLVDAYFQNRAIKYADAFKWNDKIEMMKKEYFNLIKDIRKNRIS